MRLGKDSNLQRRTRCKVRRVCFQLACDLLRRNYQKYAAIVFALFIGHWRMERWRVRLIRACYFYFRYLDDVADGDRQIREGAEHFLNRQRLQWRDGRLETTAVHETDILFEFIWNELDTWNFPVGQVRVLALEMIDGLSSDATRRRQREKIVKRTELDVYYTKVILAPARLAHLVLKAHVAPGELEEISGIIGRLLSIRDLEEDWLAGLINVPSEQVERLCAADGTLDRREILEWRTREAARCSARLRSVWDRWSNHADSRSRAIMKPAVSSLLAWSARYRGNEPRSCVSSYDFLSTC